MTNCDSTRHDITQWVGCVFLLCHNGALSSWRRASLRASPHSAEHDEKKYQYSETTHNKGEELSVIVVLISNGGA